MAIKINASWTCYDFSFNIIGAHFSLNIPVNIYTIAIVGTLRIPGLVMILIFLIL